jgi:SOS response regulatory protein OraA/RecX
VCTHQDWAYKVFNGIEQRWRKDSDKWLKELIKKGFGVEEYNEAMADYDE